MIARAKQLIARAPGVAFGESRGVLVFVVVAVNARGDVLSETNNVLRGARGADGEWLASSNPWRLPDLAPSQFGDEPKKGAIENTTLAVVVTNAKLNKQQLYSVAGRTHDGGETEER